MSKIRRNFWQLSTLIANIFGRDRHFSSESRKNHYQLQPLPRWAKKLVNSGPQTTELKWLILTNPSGHFSWDYISAIKGCCPLKFLHALEIDPGYLAHTQLGRGSPDKNFNHENLRYGLKFSVWATITPDPLGVSSWNFVQSTCRRARVITRVQFSEGPPLKFVRAKKRLKFGALFDKCLRNGSSYRKSENTIVNYNPFHVGPKKLVNFGSQTTELKWLILSNPSGHFLWDYISAIRGCCPSNFYAR